MYKIILGVIILCYGFYTLLTGDYISGGDKFIESFGSAFVLIIVGWSLLWFGLDKDKKVIVDFLHGLLKDLGVNLKAVATYTKKNSKWAFVFLLMAIVFYWFQYRPSEIRKECYKMLTASHYDFDEHFKYYEPEYNSCLIKNGITK